MDQKYQEMCICLDCSAEWNPFQHEHFNFTFCEGCHGQRIWGYGRENNIKRVKKLKLGDKFRYLKEVFIIEAFYTRSTLVARWLEGDNVGILEGFSTNHFNELLEQGVIKRV